MKYLRGLLLVILMSGAGWYLLPKLPLLEGVTFSQELFDRHGTRLAVSLTADDKYRLYRPLRDISPALITATLAQEDRYFARHPGFNPIALIRSAWRYAGSREARYGASTITMQLARLRYDLHTRTISGKLRQILHALQLERHYTKEQILEAYFNLAPYGGNLEGAGAASLAIFRKPASQLTSYEGLALSVIPQSPARRSPRRDRLNPELQEAMGRVGGPDARNFLVFLRGIPAPRAAHFVRSGRRAAPEARVIRTSLDLPLQQVLEERMRTWLERRRELGLKNSAALLVDWRSADILAQVGSADFNNPAIHGQVDGTRARRSPGSTLKPFVYALAIDQGLIHPSSVVLDAPRFYAGYNPENSDREYAGPLRASEALARSRNIPAVTLSRSLRSPSLYQFLQEAGVCFARDEDWYGLSLALGGTEVRMTDLVALYSILANDGKLNDRAILSPEAAFLTREMLSLVPPPEGHSVRVPVYWKTGTSHGYHDAWAVGICGPYVLAVWVGNFNGQSNPALVGRQAAAPLFFQILESLESRNLLAIRRTDPPFGANLRQVAFCESSGNLPGDHCARRREGWFIPGISPISVCTLHREVLVDRESGLRVRRDDGSKAVRREVFEFWPADIEKLFAAAGLPRRVPPPFEPGQPGGLNSTGNLQVVSPRPGAILSRMGPGVGTQGVPLRVNANADTRRVFWFDGRQFLGAAAPERALMWKPTAGVHRLIAIDQDGRQGAADIRVEVSALTK